MTDSRRLPRAIGLSQRRGPGGALQILEKRNQGEGLRPDSRTSHLFDRWEEISRRVRAAKGVKLFLDFDGTLVDFHFRPDQVKLSGQAQAALRKLARHRSISIAIVSGRRRATLIRHVQVPRVAFFGLYGWENRARRTLPRKTILKLSQVRIKLANLPTEVPGVRIEDKGMSVAVHFRGASPEARRCARARIGKFIAGLHQHFRIIRAHMIWDVVPQQVLGKDDAIREALANTPPAFLPIYLGDDLTDEPAFSFLRGGLHCGITVLVGPARRTHARFRLRNAGEVCQFLERLEGELS